MRVLICGNCMWEGKPEDDMIYDLVCRYKLLVEGLDHYDPLVIISGMASGADKTAWKAAKACDVYCDEFPWNEAGRRKARLVNPNPSHMRNQWMLESGVDVCHAFAYSPDRSSGTRDMVVRCLNQGDIPVYWHTLYKSYKVLGFSGNYSNMVFDLEEVPFNETAIPRS